MALASNLIIIGSPANMAGVRAAASKGFDISFWSFPKLSLPASAAALAIDCLWVKRMVAV